MEREKPKRRRVVVEHACEDDYTEVEVYFLEADRFPDSDEGRDDGNQRHSS